MVDYVDGRGTPARRPVPTVPRNLRASLGVQQPARRRGPRAGPYGGFLGQAYDPIWTEFVGKATQKATKTLAGQTWDDFEPYRGITPESRFRLGSVDEPRPRADPRPARPPPLAAGAVRRRAPRGRSRRRGRSGIDRHRAMAYDAARLASGSARRSTSTGSRTRPATSTA